MRRYSFVVLLVSALLWPGGVVQAQSTKASSSTNRSDVPLPGSRDNQVSKTSTSSSTDSDEDRAPDTSSSQAPTSIVRWYGHAFIYIISSTGVRVAIDPFSRGTVKYLFPPRLPADTVLISTEADDHSAGELLFGTPQIFRSYTAVGLNKANGLIFKGVSVNRTARRGPNTEQCTAFVFSLDGVTFAHLGVLGDSLDSRQRQDIGHVDVLFLPVGNPQLTISDLNRIVADLQPKIIVPITYKTDLTPDMNLRPLDDYLREEKMPVKKLDKSEFPINAALLPSQPTIYVPAIP